jgi:hypothetical protein
MHADIAAKGIHRNNSLLFNDYLLFQLAGMGQTSPRKWINIGKSGNHRRATT